MRPLRETEIDDSEHEDYVITSVDGQSFTMNSGWSFHCEKKYGVTPAVGQRVRLYGKGIGYPVRGMAIDSKVLYYKTEDEHATEMREEAARRDADRRQQFEDRRAEYDARIAALPGPFRARLERFAESGPDWRWKFESYELFCCEEAVRLANHAKEPPRSFLVPAALDWLRSFRDASFDEQKAMAPTMKLEEHSGNTISCATALAITYLEDEALVPLTHGALAPLVGCEEYGCHRKEIAPL